MPKERVVTITITHRYKNKVYELQPRVGGGMRLVNFVAGFYIYDIYHWNGYDYVVEKRRANFNIKKRLLAESIATWMQQGLRVEGDIP